MSKPHWRPARASDLPAISAIAARIHPALPEREEVLAEKIRLCPDGCSVLDTDRGIAGYGLAHPWMRYRIPPLDGFLQELHDSADCLYIHDVAVLPEFRGGVVRAYVGDIEKLARASRIRTLALVSVYGTRPLWERIGFRTVTADAELHAKLASYGDGATYMLRDLAAT
ncbi:MULTISPECIES: GNAT family N-acetyltransferase [Bradyrhizobium]|uniref:GNAT family N-acetyltransferase n=1 Tax=Bradyrhizobium TaxID=374 RepID=UPI001CD4B4C6|nr:MULTISPECIES: GNAT family N-acetyltransferase [Bradyrhizobium]MCA1523785.1 GNAT family N-acetyltransferase [Bradyrhizobium yuanmingense]MCA1546016.1 GNAT family N-acetyltransferase [Bradyrhizobium sp. BRP19]